VVKPIVSSVLLTLVLSLVLTPAFVMNGVTWSNGGYTSDPANPIQYGTHDWIAEHALDWLPDKEKWYIVDNLSLYLYGTELPDNGQAWEGIGDTRLHHIYFNSRGELTDNVAAGRAMTEFNNTLNMLRAKDFRNAAIKAGTMTHYIADLAVFAHVMGSGTEWGAETHHSDYEDYVNRYTSNYSSTFGTFLVFDGYLSEISPYDAAINLAYDTTFNNITFTAVWMDQNYNWNNPLFERRVGESLNLAVNHITDVLHTLYLKSETEVLPPSEPPSSPPSPPSYLPTFPPVTIPLWTIGAAIALIALIVILALSRSRPKQARGKLVRLSSIRLFTKVFCQLRCTKRYLS